MNTHKQTDKEEHSLTPGCLQAKEHVSVQRETKKKSRSEKMRGLELNVEVLRITQESIPQGRGHDPKMGNMSVLIGI